MSTKSRDNLGNLIFAHEKISQPLPKGYKGVNTIDLQSGKICYSIYFHQLYEGSFKRQEFTFLLLNPEE